MVPPKLMIPAFKMLLMLLILKRTKFRISTSRRPGFRIITRPPVTSKGRKESLRMQPNTCSKLLVGTLVPPHAGSPEQPRRPDLQKVRQTPTKPF